MSKSLGQIGLRMSEQRKKRKATLTMRNIHQTNKNPSQKQRQRTPSLGPLLTIDPEEVVQAHQTQRRFLTCFPSTVQGTPVLCSFDRGALQSLKVTATVQPQRDMGGQTKGHELSLCTGWAGTTGSGCLVTMSSTSLPLGPRTVPWSKVAWTNKSYSIHSHLCLG